MSDPLKSYEQNKPLSLADSDIRLPPLNALTFVEGLGQFLALSTPSQSILTKPCIKKGIKMGWG